MKLYITAKDVYKAINTINEMFPLTARHKGVTHIQRENEDLATANEPEFKSYWDLSEDHEQEYKDLVAKGMAR